MKPKKLSKRAAGKKLNEEQRLSPLATLQLRLEYYDKLAREEIALGELGSRSKIDGYLELAQSAAKELAPYRHPKLTPSEPVVAGPSRIVHAPQQLSIEEWSGLYASPEALAEEAVRREKLTQALLNHVPDGKAN